MNCYILEDNKIADMGKGVLAMKNIAIKAISIAILFSLVLSIASCGNHSNKTAKKITDDCFRPIQRS